MHLETTDIAIVVYITFVIIGLVVSYLFGSKMIEKTGLFGAQTIISIMTNLLFGIFAVVGWFIFSWRVNEFLFFGGLLLGIGMSVVSQAILIIVLFVRRRKMLQIYKDNVKTSN